MPGSISTLRRGLCSPRLAPLWHFTFYFLLVALTLGRTAHYGFTGDESGYTAPNTTEIAAHPAIPIIFDMDTGHPVLYTWPVGWLWRLFGQSNTVANISIWIAAAFSLAAVHRLTGCILERSMGTAAPGWAGPAAALALFSTPLFISNAAQYLDPMPYLTLLLWLLLAWIQGRRKTVALLGGMLSLIRITGCLSVLGLGLFDLAYAWVAGRRRTWRAVLGTLAPYLASAAMFATYFFVKLVILKRPLSRIAGHQTHFADWATIRFNTRHVLGGIYGIPPYGFSILLGIAAAAFLWTQFKNLRHAGQPVAPTTAESEPSAPHEPAAPGAAAIYGASLASMLPPTLFFCVYLLYPQPRWFIPFHAFIAIAGVHGLIVLLRGRLWLVLPLLGLWCGLQAMRWHGHWVERCFAAGSPRTRARLRVQAAFSLDMTYRKQLNQKAAKWIRKHAHKPLLFCAYPTGAVFDNPSAGYMESARKVVALYWFRQQPQPEAIFHDLLTHRDEVYLVQTAWDALEEMKFLRALMPGHSFKEVFMETAPSGEWFRIYQSSARRPRQAGKMKK